MSEWKELREELLQHPIFCHLWQTASPTAGENQVQFGI